MLMLIQISQKKKRKIDVNLLEFKMDKTTFFGPHLTLDLNDCNPEKLADFDLVFDVLNALPDKIGMTKITQPITNICSNLP